MKKLLYAAALVCLIISITGCGTLKAEPTLSPVEIARNEVIDKWAHAEDGVGVGRYIEDRYKDYPDDDVISNVYFYSIAKEQYGHYQSLGIDKYLNNAIEYAEKIDPNYSGEFAEEMHAFVNSIVSEGVTQEKHEEAAKKEDKYSSLSNKDKKEICNYIESRYEYYDKKEGGYSGDKYSDTIMKEAAKKYGLTVTQIEIIWMNMYSY